MAPFSFYCIEVTHMAGFFFKTDKHRLIKDVDQKTTGRRSKSLKSPRKSQGKNQLSQSKKKRKTTPPRIKKNASLAWVWNISFNLTWVFSDFYGYFGFFDDFFDFLKGFRWVILQVFFCVFFSNVKLSRLRLTLFPVDVKDITKESRWPLCFAGAMWLG